MMHCDFAGYSLFSYTPKARSMAWIIIIICCCYYNYIITIIIIIIIVVVVLIVVSVVLRQSGYNVICN